MRVVGLALLLCVVSSCAKKDIGELCEKDSECEFGCEFPGSPSVSANRRICVQSCENDAECPTDTVCYSARCVPNCTQDDDCPEASVCWEGSLCAVACRDEGDCPMGTCTSAGGVCE